MADQPGQETEEQRREREQRERDQQQDKKPGEGGTKETA